MCVCVGVHQQAFERSRGGVDHSARKEGERRKGNKSAESRKKRDTQFLIRWAGEEGQRRGEECVCSDETLMFTGDSPISHYQPHS